jgi:hypothetical protein
VYQWVERFQECQTSLADEHCSGHLCTAISGANVVHVEALIGENRWIPVDTVTTVLNIRVGSAHDIIHETLKYSYLCSRWMLRQLTDKHKLNCMLS